MGAINFAFKSELIICQPEGNLNANSYINQIITLVVLPIVKD